jgi:hypothetical protein
MLTEVYSILFNYKEQKVQLEISEMCIQLSLNQIKITKIMNHFMFTCLTINYVPTKHTSFMPISFRPSSAGF